MGFEPFILPKREKQPEPTNRDERVASLAKLLHERGLTSSLTDAKRLAEGMVEGEKKIMKQAPKPAEPAAPPKLDMNATAPSASSLRLPEEFLRFVAQAATLSHTASTQQTSIPTQQPMRFGRETEQEIAAVPHTTPRKQVFYDEAPDLTKLRGYNGPKKQPVEFQSQQARNGSALRVSTGDAGVKVTKVEVTPQSQTVTEEMIIIDDPQPTAVKQAEPPKAEPQAPQTAPPAARPAPQSFDELVTEEFKDAPEKTVELPKSEKPREQRDLAKEHGVDLFNMFKKK